MRRFVACALAFSCAASAAGAGAPQEPELAPLEVIVLDALGRPVAGIPVRLTSYADAALPSDGAGWIDTDERGRATLRAGSMHADERGALHLQAAVLAAQPVQRALLAKEWPKQAELALPPCAAVEIAVVGADGEVDASARGRVHFVPGTREAAVYDGAAVWRTLEAGTARWPWVAIDSPITIGLDLADDASLGSLADFDRVDVAGLVSGELRRVCFDPARGHSLSVQVLEHGAPLVDGELEVLLSAERHRSLVLYEGKARTDAQGRVRIRCSTDAFRYGGLRSLRLRRPGPVDATAAVDLPAQPPPGCSDLGAVALGPTAYLASGRVLAASGRSVAHACVQLEGELPDGSWRAPQQRWQGFADEDGSFRITGLPEDLPEYSRFRVRANAPGFLDATSRSFEAGGVVELCLVAEATLSYSLAFPATERAPACLVVSLTDAAGGELIGSGGRIGGIAEGEYTFRVGLRWLGEPLFVASNVRIGPGANSDPRLEGIDLSERLAVRSIAVESSDGRPMRDPELRLIRELPSGRAPFETLCVERGTELVVPIGSSHLVVVSAPGHAPALIDTLEAHRRVVLEPLLVRTLRWNGSKPMHGTVRSIDAWKPPVPVRIGESGTASLELPGLGSYRLDFPETRVFDPPFAAPADPGGFVPNWGFLPTSRVEFAVTRDDTGIVDLAPPPPIALGRVRISDAEGRAIDGPMLLGASPWRVTAFVPADEPGVFDLLALPCRIFEEPTSDVVQVSVHAPGFAPASRSLRIGEEIVIRLERE